MLTVGIDGAIIEEIEHLLDAAEVPSEPGVMHPLLTGWPLTNVKGWSVGTLDSINQAFDLDGDFRLGETRGVA